MGERLPNCKNHFSLTEPVRDRPQISFKTIKPESLASAPQNFLKNIF